MDIIDKQILSLLSQNARMPVKEIARQVSLTSPAVSGRIRRLEQEGCISGYTVVFSPQKDAARIDALVSMSVPPAEHEAFLALTGSQRAVLQCFHVTGSYSYILKVSCRDMNELEALINRLQKHGQTSTQIILSTLLDRKPSPV